MYQSSHPGMTEMGENTASQQSKTNDRVSNKICYVHMNLFTKMRYKENAKEKSTKWHFHLELFWRSPAVVAAVLFHSVCSYSVILGPHIRFISSHRKVGVILGPLLTILTLTLPWKRISYLTGYTQQGLKRSITFLTTK